MIADAPSGLGELLLDQIGKGRRVCAVGQADSVIVPDHASGLEQPGRLQRRVGDHQAWTDGEGGAAGSIGFVLDRGADLEHSLADPQLVSDRQIQPGEDGVLQGRTPDAVGVAEGRFRRDTVAEHQFTIQWIQRVDGLQFDQRCLATVHGPRHGAHLAGHRHGAAFVQEL